LKVILRARFEKISKAANSQPINTKHLVSSRVNGRLDSDLAKLPAGQQSSRSSSDSTFYPSYLKHPTQERIIRALDAAKPLGEPDFGSSVPISGVRARPSDTVFSYYQSTSNAALWDGTGWSSIQHATQANSALSVTVRELSPPRASPAGEWHALSLLGLGAG
jgi:hypothetical protein